MTPRSILFALFAIAFGTDASQAVADHHGPNSRGSVLAERCGDRADVLEHLGRKYHEAPAFMGLAAGGYMVEVLTSDDSSTWTIVLSYPGGEHTCLLDAGENWQPLERTLPETPL